MKKLSYELSLTIVLIVFVRYPAAMSLGQAADSSRPCTLISSSSLQALIQSDGPPVQGPNGGCTFRPTKFGESGNADFDKYPTVDINLTSGWGKLNAEPTFSPKAIADIQDVSHLDCQPAFEVQGKPALWCVQYSERFREGFYALYIHDQGTMHSIYLDHWLMPPDDAKAAVLGIAMEAFFHRSPPTETLGRNALFSHRAHNLRTGMWNLLETARGEGYLNVPFLAPAAFATCIKDKGATLQQLIPHPISGCEVQVKQESELRENVAATCKGNPSDAVYGKYSDRYNFVITFVDADNYVIEGTQTKFQTMTVREGIATYERPKEIGSQSLRAVATWKNERCALETTAPVPLTATSVLNR